MATVQGTKVNVRIGDIIQNTDYVNCQINILTPPDRVRNPQTGFLGCTFTNCTYSRDNQPRASLRDAFCVGN